MAKNVALSAWLDEHDGHKLGLEFGTEGPVLKGFRCLDCNKMKLCFASDFNKDPRLAQIVRRLNPPSLWTILQEED